MSDAYTGLRRYLKGANGRAVDGNAACLDISAARWKDPRAAMSIHGGFFLRGNQDGEAGGVYVPPTLR
jgi:hypothetical protein